MKQPLARKISKFLKKHAIKSAASNKSFIGAAALPKELKEIKSKM